MALGTSFTQVTKSGLSSTSAYNTGHINSSGIITATKFVGTLEGNVTSDDWTNTATGISTTVNVGIGTTNATSKLYLKGGSNENITLKLEPGATAGNYSELVLGRTSSAPASQTTPVVKGGNAITGVPGILFGSENTNLPCVVVQTPNSSNGHIVFKPKGSEKVRITSGGDVLIGGHTSSIEPDNYESSLQVTGTDTAAGISILRYSNDTASPTLLFGKSRGTSIGAIGEVQNGDSLGKIEFYGTDTGWESSASVRASADGEWYSGSSGSEDNTDAPGRLEFHTTPDGADNMQERLRIDSGGRLFTGASQTLLDSIAGTIHIDGAGNGGRIALRGTTTSAGGGLGEIFAYWNNTKVAGIIALAGADNNNKDDGHLTFYTRPDTATGVQERLRIHNDGQVTIGNDPTGAGSWDGDLVVANTNGGRITVGDTGSGEKFSIAANGDINLYSYLSGDNINFHTTNGSGTGNRLVIDASGQATHTYDIGSDGDAGLILNTDDGTKAPSILFRANSENRARLDVKRRSGDGGIVTLQVARADNSNNLVNVFTSQCATSGDTTPDLTLGGNLVLANGHGIDFSATGNGGSSPTGVSELFNDYETGTFVVTLANSLSVHTQTKLTYTKIGNKCHISGQFRINTGGSDLTINNLPFTTVNTGGTDETFSIGIVGLYYVSMPSDGNASGEVLSKTQKNDNNMYFVYNRHNTDPNGHTATANGYYTISHWYTVST